MRLEGPIEHDMGKRVRLKRGDIYRFDLDETRYGVGQIVEPGKVFYITVLRTPVLHGFDLEMLDTRDILLCGWTTDALFFHERWHVIGSLPVQEDVVPRPCSKVRVEGKPWISDFRAQPVRPATRYEWEHLDYHRSHSPITYQKAFQAYHGLEPVEPYYADLSIQHVRAQAAICST